MNPGYSLSLIKREATADYSLFKTPLGELRLYISIGTEICILDGQNSAPILRSYFGIFLKSPSTEYDIFLRVVVNDQGSLDSLFA